MEQDEYHSIEVFDWCLCSSGFCSSPLKSASNYSRAKQIIGG